MSSEIGLVTELAVILISAGIFTIISKALKQPLVLGYIVAGFIIGPHLGLFPQFSPESVEQWSELGIIFLLFGLGLEFNLKNLLSVGSAAIITAGTICIGMFLTGFITGTALGWTKMECIFLGGMLSMSSTTIIIKAYEDLNMKDAPYANLVFGLLVVEDLIAVLIMVLLSTLAVSNRFSGSDMLMSLVKLVAFLVICFVTGIYLIPSILRKTRKYLSDEILLLISVGLCFLTVILAHSLGFSSALGAFLMGTILSSTIEGERIEHITVNIKNLFGAIFFVSVGMMVDPSVIASRWPVILVITLVVMVGILLFSTAGALFSGKDLDTSLHVGFSLPQLGEFSLIIASLGTSLGVIREFIYPVIISVSVITTFTTPYMIKAANPVSGWLHARLPSRIVARFAENARLSQYAGSGEDKLGKRYAKKYIIRLSVYSMLIIVLQIGMKTFFPLIMKTLLPQIGAHATSAIEVGAALIILSPFIYGLAVNGSELRDMAGRIVENNPRFRIPIMAATAFRILLAIEFSLSAVLMFSQLSRWNILLVVLSVFVVIFSSRKATRRYASLENRFFDNLNAKDEYARRNAPVRTMVGSKLAGRDVHIETLTVSPDFSFAGKMLREMPFRHNTGINIVKIQRGSSSILIPGGDEKVMPGDQLFAVGTREQLSAFVALMNNYSVRELEDNEEFDVAPVVLSEGSPLAGIQLGQCGMRAENCMVISVERDGVTYTNPDKNFRFHPGDIVWLAGIGTSVRRIEKANGKAE